jgi:pantetheine-phosphate adenylyltransferase
MTKAIYPGTFDPITCGHLDLIGRASRIFDRLIVAVGINPQKHPLFSAEERVEMIRSVTAEHPHVEVAAFTGLTVHFAQKSEIYTIIRSLRTTTEFELELATALSNRQLDERLETVFLAPGLQYTHLSSTVVREIAQFGGDLTQFVPPLVADKLRRRFGDRSAT